jgi:ABC-type Mn2+/Zn2+ transport system permease subunit
MKKDYVRWILTGAFVLTLIIVVLYGVFADNLDGDFKTAFLTSLSFALGYYFHYKINNTDTDLKG